MQVIQNWPGGEGTRVPTVVVYDRDQDLSSWGFLCAGDTGPGKVQHECPWLADLGNPGRIPTRSIPGCLYLIDFLDQLYRHVMGTISSALGMDAQDWAALGVEFHFTLPDQFHFTLQDVDPSLPYFVGESKSRILEKYYNVKNILREAGIGTGGPRHCSVLGLTETEAAATTILEQHAAGIQPFRTLLINLGVTYATIIVVDRDDFETDRVKAASQVIDRYSIQLVPLPRFDALFVEHVQARLKEHPEAVSQLDIAPAERLAHTPGFRDISDVLHEPTPRRDLYRLPLEGVSNSFRYEPLKIEDGTIGFTE